MEQIYSVIFENYKMSNWGNCKKYEKRIKGSINRSGYRYFQVKQDGKRVNYMFHIAVAKLFLGENVDNLHIEHIDKNRLNNRVSNLRYITKPEKPKVVKSIKREGGTGCIQQRKDSGSWRATITIDNIKYDKTFKLKEEAEEYINELKPNNIIW